MEKFNQIIGAKLIEITNSSGSYFDIDDNQAPLNIESICLRFDLGRFIIENPFKVKTEAGEPEEIKSLIGCNIKNAYTNYSHIVLVFEAGTTIEVSLRDEDYTSPEAASYEPTQGNIVVFN